MQRFKLGKVVMTAGVDKALKQDEALIDFVYNCLFKKFHNGDWGDMCKEDLQANDEALKNGDRLFASYAIPEQYRTDHTSLWIITEWDRSVTTILFPEEY